MQKLTCPFAPGETVSARGHLWRLRSATAHSDCVALDLESAESAPDGHGRVLLMPFDEVRPVAARQPLVLSRRAFWHTLGARFVSAGSHDGLIAPVKANLDLLPYQLEPAIAMLAGGVPRVLLADAVGLGKTVQAGIIVAELFARREASRGLFLVPAGLCDQWARELRSRFHLDADVVDGSALCAITASLPRTVNPWMVPRLAVVSVDFAKRPEVRLGLHEITWDVLVIDEAHLVGTDSERRRAAHLLALQARRVILITATPHDGHEAGFTALTGIGATHDAEPLVMFRRSRRDVGLDTRRRVSLLRVRLSAAELAALRALLAYVRRIWRERATEADGSAGRLAAIVLLKRALSSPASLLRSIVRRRSLLSAVGSPAPRQLALPLDDALDPADDEPLDVLGARGLGDVAVELAWLDHLAAAAQRAASDHGKLRALGRLLRRAQEPVVVFTEYRDTLGELEVALGRARRCVSLHGGLGRDERERALRAFADGRADVLLATDAAGTGLNLQQRCRLIVNLELPWSPVRLEQRAGRVDRLGQTRVVHAVHLVGRATPEERILARLVDKAERARHALGDQGTESLRHVAEPQTAELLLGHASLTDLLTAAPIARGGVVPDLVRRLDLDRAGVAEADALRRRRLIRAALERHAQARRPDLRVAAPSAPVVTFVRARPGHAGSTLIATPGILAIFDLSVVDARGHMVDEALVPIHLVGRVARPVNRREALALARQVVAAVHPPVKARLDNEVRRRLQRVQSQRRANQETARGRNEAQRRALELRVGAGSVQQGLFDRRAERGADRLVSRASQRLALSRADGLDVEVPSAFVAAGPRLGWVMVITA